MQGPPPPMMQPPMRNWNRIIVLAAVGLGLLLLAIGMMTIHVGNQVVNPANDTIDAQIARENLVTVWGPIILDFGMFLFVGGLVLAALTMEELDPFVRVFLLILAFVALLLILARPSNIFP